MAKKDDELFDENGNPTGNGNTDDNGQEDNSSEFRLATDENGNETIEAVKPLDAAVVPADAPNKDNLTADARTQEGQTINTTGSPTPEPTRKEARQARRAERRAARQTGETNEPPVEETATGGVTKNPTGGVTENPSETGGEERKPEPELEQAGTGVNPDLQAFNESIPQRQEAFNENIQNIQNSVDTVTPAPAPAQPETGEEDDSTLTPEQRVEKYGGDADALAKAGYDTAGNPLEAGEAATAGAGAGQAYADDPRVQGVQESNAIMEDAGRTYDQFYKDFLAEQKAYDEERTRRDSENAFWRGIGEVGASLANLLGVTGAFGGKNAYGKGAYSAMQNFNLTTAGLTDKMKADMDKRRERMDALKERQAQIGLQLAQIRAKGAADLGNAKGAAADAAEKRAEAQRNRDFQAEQNQIKMNFQAGEAQKDRNLKIELADRQNKASLKAAEIRASGKGSGNTDESKVRDVFRYVGTDEDGKPVDKRLVTDRKSLKHVFNNTAGWLADEIAREAGYRNYADFASADRKRKDEVASGAADKAKYNDDIKRLELYDDALMLAGLTGLDTKNENALAEWVWSNGGGYEKYGDRVSDYLQLNGLLFTDESSGPQEEVTEIIDYVPKSEREK